MDFVDVSGRAELPLRPPPVLPPLTTPASARAPLPADALDRRERELSQSAAREPDPVEAIAEQTFRQEAFRAVSTGVLETASVTFLVYMAVRYFHVAPLAKGLLASTGNVGYLLAPGVVFLSGRFHLTLCNAAAILFLLCGICFVPAAVSANPFVFVAGATAAMALANASVALFTQLYRDNYPDTCRGTLLAKTVRIRIASLVVFSWLGARILNYGGPGIAFLLFIFSLAAIASGIYLARCPSRQLLRSASSFSLESLRSAFQDRIFRNTLICWMLMGFGNLMMVSLRVEYLANPAHGLILSAAEVALFSAVVPNLARLLLSGYFGRLFDRVNFFALRLVLNLFFAVAIVAFFCGSGRPGLFIGSAIFGAANAGGDIAWSLWVTKIAPSEKVASYMSIHAFFTGIRGLLAPLTAFYLIQFSSITAVAVLSVALILVANFWLLPDWKAGLTSPSGAGCKQLRPSTPPL